MNGTIAKNWITIQDPEKMEKVIVDWFSRNHSYLRTESTNTPESKFISKKPNGLFVVELPGSEPTGLPGSIGQIFLSDGRQVELEFEVVQTKDNLMLIRPKLIRYEHLDRKSPRIGNLIGKVSAGHFQVSKDNFDISKLFGVTTSVLLQDIHKKVVESKFPQAHLVFAQAGGEPVSEEMHLAFQSRKPIFITNTQTMDSPNVELPLFDLKKEYEEELSLEEHILDFKRKKIDSFVIYPVLIPFALNKEFAFLCFESPSGPTPTEILDLYKEVENTFLERIMDSNTHTIDVKQNVINVSLHGAALEINDERIRRSIRVKPTLTADLNFKMQAPIRVSMQVRHIKDCGDYDLVGLEIQGFSGDPDGFRKFKEYIEFIQKI
jgi:hypothetical protein